MANIETVLMLLLIASSICDLIQGKVPNFLSITGAITGCAFHFSSQGVDGLFFSLFGIVIGVGLLLVPYILGGMGAGDVKLMGAVGSFLGAKAVFEAFLLIAVLGGIYSVVLILVGHDAFKNIFVKPMILLVGVAKPPIRSGPTQNENTGRKPRLKYGVPIALGTITYLILKSLGIQSFI